MKSMLRSKRTPNFRLLKINLFSWVAIFIFMKIIYLKKLVLPIWTIFFRNWSQEKWILITYKTTMWITTLYEVFVNEYVILFSTFVEFT